MRLENVHPRYLDFAHVRKFNTVLAFSSLPFCRRVRRFGCTDMDTLQSEIQPGYGFLAARCHESQSLVVGKALEALYVTFSWHGSGIKMKFRASVATCDLE